MIYVNSKIQRCLEIVNRKNLVGLQFVDVPLEESLMDVAKAYALAHQLHTGNWTSHDTNGLVSFQTVIICNDDGDAVETLASIKVD